MAKLWCHPGTFSTTCLYLLFIECPTLFHLLWRGRFYNVLMKPNKKSFWIDHRYFLKIFAKGSNFDFFLHFSKQNEVTKCIRFHVNENIKINFILANLIQDMPHLFRRERKKVKERKRKELKGGEIEGIWTRRKKLIDKQ